MAKGCWKPSRQKYGVVVASYNSAVVLHSLALQFGETVHIWEEYWADEKTVTWMRGCTFNNRNKKGIFPALYIQTKECTVENEGPTEVVTPVDDAIIKEVTFVLREWHGRLKSLFVTRKSLFHTILLIMGELCKFRSTLVSNTLTKEHAEEMKHQVVTMIDWGNGQLGMDLVPRINYEQADADNVSVVEMFRIHEKSVQNIQGAYVEEEPDGAVKVTDRGKQGQGEAIHHLLVSFCSFACNVGDNSEVLLSLYDNKEGKFISEKFVIYFTKDGQREGSDKNSSTIFTDLNSEDIRKDIYLVVQILRKGRLTTEGHFKKIASFHYRRPWGVSVLCLRDVIQINNELEYFIRIQCVENESFYNMHESLIKKQIQMIGKASSADKQNQGVTLSMKLLHGDMKTVKIENPILFSKGVVLTQRMGFPEFINPGEIRNDLYLTLHGADFDRGSKTASKNVEVKVAVYNEQYEVIKDCILPANGDTMKSSFYSYVLYHNNNPKWNETIRLSIPIEKFSTAHIRLELCHCSNRDKAEKKMIGFAYLAVTMKENTTRLDGKYDLCIYKCEDFSKVKNYMRLPSLREDFTDLKVIPNNIPYQHSNREYITVETLLCSTKFAQKAELLSVLQYASNYDLGTTIPQSLENLSKLKGQELVPYLQDILDALFNMFTAGDGRSVPFASNIFETLVYIFNLLHKEMFEKFSIVLEDYLEKSFSSTLAHREIMQCLKNQAERVYTCTDFDEKSSKTVFRVLEDIFKFSVKSCMLSQRMYGGKSVAEFKQNLNNIFEAFGKVVSSREKELQKVQAQLLNNLHRAYTPLLFVISNSDLAQLVVFILTKINQQQSGPVVKAKTNLIKNTINSQLVSDSKSRSMLLPLILNHLKKCLAYQNHLELTSSTLGDLLTTVYKLKETCDIKDEVALIIQGLFDTVVRTLGMIQETNKKTSVSLLVACLTEMLRLMDVTHYQKLTGDFPTQKKLKEFLNRVLMVFRNLVRTDDLPADWTTMRMITSSVMLSSIQYIADDLRDNFLQGDDFDRELWYNFFLLAVDFITQPALQLEKYSEAKSSQIKSKYSDMRVPVGLHICSLWNQLGQNKQHLLLDLIGPFLKCTMVPQLELRRITIPIFFDIMQCEYGLKGDLRRVEGVMIQELDSLVLEHHGDDEYKKLLKDILLEKVKAEPKLQKEGTRFVNSITDLLERLLDYREIMDREEQRDTKMHCTFNILNYYKDSRRDMYIRYISRLYELHYSASNFVEAGLTLRLYAELLTWSQSIHNAEMSYRRQTEAARKEELFSRIMDCFDKGKAWEYGIPLCKELAEHYENTFQYKKLGHILQKQAYFLYQILEGSKFRQAPSYYRVAYFGNTFPPYLKNKAFIYRGDECLKLATIMNQLMTEYPSATILTTNSPPEESCKMGDAQFIQIVSVKPVPSERPEFAGKVVPSEVSFFYNTNEVNTFQFDRPYHRGPKDENNEFKSLCLERTVMQTVYKLPGILRWYEVVSTQVVHLGPVQTATNTVKQMNDELKSSSENACINPDLYLRHLEMRLQGVISGAVNGGIPKYQQAFFNEEYIAKYPKEKPYIDELKSVILEQIQSLENCLAIHGKYASTEMIPLHRSLTDMFTNMKNSMGYQNLPSAKNRGSSGSIGLGNHRPGSPSGISQNSSGSNRSSELSGCDVPYLDDESLYEEPPECSLPVYDDPRGLHNPSEDCLKGIHRLSQGHSQEHSTQPPPIPQRKISVTSGPFSELDRAPVSSVQRSESTKSSDFRASCTESQFTTLRKINTAHDSNEDSEEFGQDVPPLPVKRPSISSLSRSQFGGSNSSISSSSTSSESRNVRLSTSSSIVNSDDVSGVTQKQPPMSPINNTASPVDEPPPLIVSRSPSNRSIGQSPNPSPSKPPPLVPMSPSNNTASPIDEPPPPIVSRSPSNRSIGQSPNPSSSPSKPPPLVPMSPSNNTASPVDEPPPSIVSRSPSNRSIGQSPNPSPSPSKPPPLVPRVGAKKEDPVPLPLYAHPTTAMTPPRTVTATSPPPIPSRKPSVAPS